MTKVEAIAASCEALTHRGAEQAARLLKEYYPHSPAPVPKRRFRLLDYSRVFIRDGFIDRYTGDRLIYPPVLRMLSHAIPEQCPYHPNWKAPLTHPAYWEVGATIDHVLPVTRGGIDEPSNWVTTSMVRNAAKMNWTPEELGWQLGAPGEFVRWDGLMRWYVEYANVHPEALARGLRQWASAARQAIAEVDAS